MDGILWRRRSSTHAIYIEYSGNEISDEKLNEIHTQFKQDIREQSQALFQKLQQLHVDPIWCKRGQLDEK